MSFIPEEDRRLLDGCFSGDRKAAELLIRRFSGLVYRFVQQTLIVKSVSYSRQDLEDLHNTVFLQLFENACKRLRQFQGKNGCSLTSWIRIITVRIVLGHLRQKGLDALAWQKRKMSFEDLPEISGSDAGTWEKIESAEQALLLKNGVQSLGARDRLLVKLHFEQGLSMAEVAEAMNLSRENAYTIKHRAIKRVKAHIKSCLN